MTVRRIHSFLQLKYLQKPSAPTVVVSKHSTDNQKLHRAYRAVGWSLNQAGNEGKEVVTIPKWALYTLIDASRPREDRYFTRMMWVIVGLSVLMLVSTAILVGFLLIRGGL